MKKTFLKLTLIGLCLLSINSIAQSDKILELDLQTALKIAQDNNPTIKIAELEIQRVDYSRKEAIGNLLPSLNASGQYIDNVMKQVMFMPKEFAALSGGKDYMEIGSKNSYTLGASASLPLVNFTVWQNIKNKQNEIDLIIEKCRSSKIEMTKQVKDAYFSLLLAKSSLQVLEKSYNNAKNTLKNVENSYNQGVVSEYDYIRAQVQVNNLNPTLITAKNGVELATLQIKMILSLPEDPKIEIKESLDSFSDELSTLDEASQVSTYDNSDLRQLDYNIKNLQNQLKVINTQHYPMLSAFGQYSYLTQAENFKFSDYKWVSAASIGLQLNVPIFAGMTKVHQAKQVKLAIKGLEMQKDYAKEGINLTMKSAINTMKSAKEQLFVNKDAIKQAERGYEIAKVRYQVGSGTILELNDSELSLTQAHLNYQQSIYNFLNAKSSLEKIIGKE